MRIKMRRLTAVLPGWLAVIAFLASTGCSSMRKSGSAADGQYQPRIKWYAHCEACNWCRGSYKTRAEVQQVVSEHNIKLHDWIKVAYYDQTDCD